MRTRLALVTPLVALGVWGSLWANQQVWRDFPQPLAPFPVAILVLAATAIAWAVLLTTKPTSPARDTARATALGVLTVVLPACQLSLLFPSLFSAV